MLFNCWNTFSLALAFMDADIFMCVQPLKTGFGLGILEGQVCVLLSNGVHILST